MRSAVMEIDAILDRARKLGPESFVSAERLIESWATPRQFLELGVNLAGSDLAALGRQVQHGKLWRFLHTQASLRAFKVRHLTDDATHYVSLDTADPTGTRTALVCFAASGGRLTLPIAAFLQSIGNVSCDVFLLRDPYRNHFRSGCPALGSDFHALSQTLSELVRPYLRHVALGTSMGGAPAVRFGLLTGAALTVAIGARRWNDIARLTSDPAATQPFDLICDCLKRTPRNIVLVHSASHIRDEIEALQMARLTGGTPVAIAGLSSHHVLAEAWLSGNLAELLDRLLAPAGQACLAVPSSAADCQDQPRSQWGG